MENELTISSDVQVERNDEEGIEEEQREYSTKDMIMIINSEQDLMFTESKRFAVNSEKRRIIFE
tara:strand:+ start:270 stop:461 length:192 start_codon:yes stop_codon:yes gene_type:complete